MSRAIRRAIRYLDDKDYTRARKRLASALKYNKVKRKKPDNGGGR